MLSQAIPEATFDADEVDGAIIISIARDIKHGAAKFACHLRSAGQERTKMQGSFEGRIGPRRERARSLWRIVVVALLSAYGMAQPADAAAFAHRSFLSGDLPGRGHLQIADRQVVQAPEDRASKIEDVNTLLKHIYAIYLGLRACTELSIDLKDQSFQPNVSLEQARQVLKSVDSATAEVGIHSDEVWTGIAPQATVSAEGLKVDPAKNVDFCRKMGGLFRVDESNLQSTLHELGAKTPLILKDY